MGHPDELQILHFVQDDNPKIPTPPTEGGMGHPVEQQILHFVQDDNPKIPTPPTDGGMGHPVSVARATAFDDVTVVGYTPSKSPVRSDRAVPL